MSTHTTAFLNEEVKIQVKAIKIRRGIHKNERRLYVTIYPTNMLNQCFDMGAVDSTSTTVKEEGDGVDTMSDYYRFGKSQSDTFTFLMDFDVTGVVLECRDMQLTSKKSVLGAIHVNRESLRERARQTSANALIEIPMKESYDSDSASGFKGTVHIVIAVQIKGLLTIDRYDEVVYPPTITFAKYQKHFPEAEPCEKILHEQPATLHKGGKIRSGRMYVTQFGVYYYTKKMLGLDRVVLIMHFSEFDNVMKTKSVGVMNNALRFVLKDETHNKLSFKSTEDRDLAWDWIEGARKIEPQYRRLKSRLPSTAQEIVAINTQEQAAAAAQREREKSIFSAFKKETDNSFGSGITIASDNGGPSGSGSSAAAVTSSQSMAAMAVGELGLVDKTRRKAWYRFKLRMKRLGQKCKCTIL